MELANITVVFVRGAGLHSSLITDTATDFLTEAMQYRALEGERLGGEEALRVGNWLGIRSRQVICVKYLFM